jgi:hypothetical protein
LKQASTAFSGAQTMQDLIERVVTAAEAQVRGAQLTSAAAAAAAAAAVAGGELRSLCLHAWQEQAFGGTYTHKTLQSRS